MPRTFNITGPCHPRLHYLLPPEARLPQLSALVAEQQSFVVHAARQTGKSTAMLAFTERLRQEGLAALYVTLEQCQGFDEVEAAEPLWLTLLDGAARRQHPSLPAPDLAAAKAWQNGDRLGEWLRRWCAGAGRPTVVVFDEVDVLQGPALVSLLRQLRAGFSDRVDGGFPASVALVGLRDLRDYLTESKDGERVNPGSPFHVKATSLRVRDFSAEEVAALYAQHTAETGQVFTDDAVARAFWWTRGQPFLTNAVARLADAAPARSPSTTRLPRSGSAPCRTRSISPRSRCA
jgi:AAA domain